MNKHHHPSKWEREGPKRVVVAQNAHTLTFWEMIRGEERSTVGDSLVALEARLAAIDAETAEELSLEGAAL